MKGTDNVAIKVYETSDAAWSDALSAMPYDFYYLPGYLALEAERTAGKAIAIHITGDEWSFLLPLIVRPMPENLGSEFSSIRDAVSPYGYPGPLMVHSGDDRDAHWSKSIDALLVQLAEMSVCTAFVRMHPFFPVEAKYLKQKGQLVLHGETVWIDLTEPEDVRWKMMRENHRRVIKKLRNQGAKVVIDSGWERLPEFISLYHDTMSHVGAASWYSFPESYFRALRQALGESAILCFVELNGQTICGGIFTAVNGLIQYHLGGTLTAARETAPSRLMFDYLCTWGKERGHRILHLGGGVGGKADALFHFKAGFSAQRAHYMTWRTAALPDVVARANSEWEKRAGVALSTEDDFFPLYRRPLPNGESR